ncbi:MAG: acriflavine resistance protein B [Planctomycetia bacterium]|nr:acriflavine resistance protein B [Planctomycetia bacterium]
MSLSRPFILRPVATWLLMVALLLAGLLAWRALPISALPQVDYPTIQVVTFHPGASPEVITATVTAPLERQFAQVPGLAQMTSTSSAGCSTITLRFALDLDIDVATQQVQAAINAAAAYLPRDLPNPPVYTKTNPADAPVLTLALTSDTLPLSRVQDLADSRLAQRISQLSGVGLVTLSGGQKPAIRIQANPAALAAMGLGMEDLRSALVQASVNMAKGSLDGSRQAFTIAADDQLLTSAEFRDLVIGWRNGAAIRLTDVAEVVDGVENVHQAAWMNDRPAVIVNIQRQPGANIIAVVDAIKALLPRLEAALPAAVRVHVLTDRTTTIRAGIAGVQHELLLTVALVVFIIFVFLRDLTATVIPGVAVPLSLVGTCAVMHLLGYSLNNLTLMALTISTGFVVDDAIVMIENVVRHLERGAKPLEAALVGAAEIGFTIVSLSVSLVAVLIPLLFMGDIVGRLFREFAVTLAVTILVSAVVSLTLTPMMCATLLTHRSAGGQGWFHRVTERFFDGALAAYAVTLRAVLRNQGLTLAVAVATLGLTVELARRVPKGFFPAQDTGVVLGITTAPPSISFTALAERQQALNTALLADPAVESLSSFIGVDGINATPNAGRILVNLVPLEARHEDAAAVIRRLRQRAAAVAGITLHMQPVQEMTVETRVSRTQYQYALESADAAELAEWGPRLVERLAALPQLADVTSDQQEGGLEARLVIDRDSAARLGVTPQMIDDVLYDACGQRQISILFTQLNQYRVVLETLPEFRRRPEDLAGLHVLVPARAAATAVRRAGERASDAPGRVPLAAVTRLEETTVPLVINRQGQFPAVTVSFNLAPGVSLGDAVAAIAAARRDLGLPPGIQTAFQGTAAAFESSLANQAVLVLAAIVAVYIVLGVLYESFVHPVTILSTLPSAGVGALAALLWRGLDLDVISLIGVILLIGIVKKNAIMMIDFALDAARHGIDGRPVGAVEAIEQACLLRFRPIMMTTMAALLGAVPLALGSGVGSELRRPLGITIIGGLVVSQVLTLYTTPVIYLWFDRLATRFRGGAPAAEAAPEPDA